jgi:hypothetical protein
VQDLPLLSPNSLQTRCHPVGSVSLVGSVQRCSGPSHALEGGTKEKYENAQTVLIACAAGRRDFGRVLNDVHKITRRKSLDQANLKDVSVSQDRDKGVETSDSDLSS